MRNFKITLLLLLTLCLGAVASAQKKDSPVRQGDTMLQGYGKTVSGKDFPWYSHVEYAKDALITRFGEGEKVTEWETETVPADLKSQYVTFVWIAGVSINHSGMITMPVDLSVNGKKVLTFDTGQGPEWDVTGTGGAALSFRGMKIHDDNYGYMFLRLPKKMVKPGKPVTLTTETSVNGYGSWVMMFQNKIQGSTLSARSYPAILKGSGKQPVVISFNHVGAPAKAIVKVGGEKVTETLSFGNNEIEIPVDPVSEECTESVEIEVDGKRYTAEVAMVPPFKWQMNAVQHTHTDIGYTRPQHAILAEHIRFIDYALDYCDQTDDYPEEAKFRWTCEAAWCVAEFIRTRPQEQVDRLIKRIREGRIEVMGMYFNFDELPDEQALAYSLQPLKTLRENGIEVEGAMQNDVNGIGWCFNEFFPDMGIRYLTMGTHGHKALICFDKPTVFWWESPSGKKVLAYRAEHYNQGNFLQIETGNFDLFEARTFDYLVSLERRDYPFNIISYQYSGYFTDNSPPSTAACETVRKWNEKYEWPKLKLALSVEFLKEVEKNYGDKIQTIRGAWPDWWTDGFASGAREAAVTRLAQNDIISNQIGLSMARVMGADVPESVNQEIDQTNRAIVFYGEHTFGYAGSISEPFSYETMEQRSFKASYAWESFRRSRPVGETALGLLQGYVERNKEHSVVAVFNPMNWNFTGTTTLYIDHQILPLNRKAKLVDENGKEAKLQIFKSRSDATYWRIWVEDVPALGAKTYEIVITDEPAQPAERMASADPVIENEWYRIEFDMSAGTVKSWYDKQLGKDLLDGKNAWRLGELIYETDDARGHLDGFRPGNFKRYVPEEVHFAGMTKGDIWDTYRFEGTSPAGMGQNNFWVEFQVYKVSKQIRMTYRLRKKLETNPESVYVSFPFELPDGKIYFDVPGGTIEAGVDQIKGSANDWNTVQNFAAVRNSNEQIVLVSNEVPLMQFGNINLGRFKAGAVPETNNIYSWVMTNYWVTNFNADQHGEFEWTYSLTSSDDPSDAFATRYAWNERIPVLARVIPAGKDTGNRKMDEPALKIDNENLLLVNMCPVKGENALMLHLREIAGKSAEFKVSSPFSDNLKCTECDAIGDPIEGGSLEFNPYEIKFIKIEL